MELSELKAKLSEGVVKVTFKKVNGDLRIMDCTTKADLIPPPTTPAKPVQVSEETKERVVRVYDVNANGWRSFVLANVIEVA